VVSPFAPHRSGDQYGPVDQYVTFCCQGARGKVLADAGLAGRVKLPRRRKPQHLVLHRTIGMASRHLARKTRARKAVDHVAPPRKGRLKGRNQGVIDVGKGKRLPTRSAISKFNDNRASKRLLNLARLSPSGKITTRLFVPPALATAKY